MKLKTLSSMIMVAAAAAFLAPAARADVLYPDAITISGFILKQTPSEGTGTDTLPLTIANVLAVLGNPANPKQMRYYYDQDIDGFVIAPKGIAAGATATPTAVVFTFGPTTTSWNGKAGKQPQYVHAGTGATGFDSGLTGGRQDESYKLGKSGAKVTTTAILVGTTGGINTIASLSINWVF